MRSFHGCAVYPRLQAGLLLLSVWLTVLITATSGQNYYSSKIASKCFSVPGVPKLEFNQCKPGEMIVVTEAIQGIGRSPGQCSYITGDCTEPVTADTEEKLHEECIGKSACEITVSVAWMPRCSAYSSYNYLKYNCVPLGDTQDICVRGSRTVVGAGYIKTPNYPNTYDAGVECMCNITATKGSVMLKFPDASLEWSESCRKDSVQVYSEGHFKQTTRCGKLPRMYNVSSNGKNIKIFFKTDTWNQDKGFLMHYQAAGTIKVSCSPSKWMPTTAAPTTARTTVPTAEASTATTTLSDTSVPQSTAEPGTGEKSGGEEDDNNGSLIGIILACVITVIILVVLVVLLIRFKRKRHKEKISRAPVEARPPRIRRNHGEHPPGSPSSYIPGSPSTESQLSAKTDDSKIAEGKKDDDKAAT